MTTPVGAPNFSQLDANFIGVETSRGTAATPTNKWYGAMALMRHQSLADSNDYGGTWFADYVPTRGAVMVDGSWTQKLAYEDANVFRYGIKGGVAAVDDGNTVHGYTYNFTHNPTADDLDTFTREGGDPAMIWTAGGLLFPEMTISGDIDDAEAVWKLNAKVVGISHDLKAGLDDQVATSGSTTTFVKSGAAWTVNQYAGAWVHFKTGTAGNIGFFRQVISNTATALTFAALPSAVASADTIDVYPQFTAGISDRTREYIAVPGTTLALDAAGGTIGATPIPGRVISFSVTEAINANYKRFMDNTNTMSNRLDRGKVKVTGQVRIELDRKREWDKYKAMAPELIRIQQLGSAINTSPATTKKAIIDIYNAVWNDPTFDVRGNNKTATWPFVGYVDATLGYPMKVAITNKQSVLLA